MAHNNEREKERDQDVLEIILGSDATTVSFTLADNRRKEVSAIFREDYERADIGSGGVEASVPYITVRLVDTEDVAEGDTARVNSNATDYLVKNIRTNEILRVRDMDLKKKL